MRPIAVSFAALVLCVSSVRGDGKKTRAVNGTHEKQPAILLYFDEATG